MATGGQVWCGTKDHVIYERATSNPVCTRDKPMTEKETVLSDATHGRWKSPCDTLKQEQLHEKGVLKEKVES